MPLLHLGPLQIEVPGNPSAGMMIPPVVEQDATDIQNRVVMGMALFIIAATGFERIPMEPRPRNAEASLARCSHPLDGRQAPLRDRPSGRMRRVAVARLHFHPYGIAAADSFRIHFDSRRMRVEIVQKEFDFKPMLARAGLHPPIAEAQGVPLPIHVMPPIDHLPAHRALIRRALTIGGRGREIVLPGVWRTARSAEKRGCQAGHAVPPSRATQAVGIPSAPRA